MRGWIAGLLALGLAASAQGEEGMWTFQNVPADSMRAAYRWAPDEAWLARVQGASARIAAGCSAAVVSGRGLVLTNHHCVSTCLTSRDGADLRAEGVRTERRCQGMTIDAPLGARDVTAEIEAATTDAAPAAFARVRDEAIARLVAACEADACEVAPLYQGGQYWLYSYRRFTDVRLVFAPEADIAHFGGEDDNFQFPRHAFDVALLRLYENGRPAATPAHLSFRAEPLRDGELTLVAGYPGATERLLTIAQMAQQRDQLLPLRIAMLRDLRSRVQIYALQGEPQRRASAELLYSAGNLVKALEGRRAALADRETFGLAERAEAALQAHLNRDMLLAPVAAGAWREIEAASRAYAGFYAAHQLAEPRLGQGSVAMIWARHIIRAADERETPETRRLAPYAGAQLAATRAFVLNGDVMDRGLEEARVVSWLTILETALAADHPLRRRALGDEAPEALAARLVRGTTLFDPAVRRALWDGGAAAVAASTDPLIVYMRAWDSDARVLRARYEQDVEAPIARAQERIAQARFRAFGDDVYPDATFSLRLSFGRVAGWTEPNGRVVGPLTTLGGLWPRAGAAAPMIVPQSWLSARGALDDRIVFNAVTTNDTIGGSSGSPVLDSEGRIVGVAFDGNIHSLGGAYVYDGRRNRTILLSAQVIDAALRRVYGLDALADEMAGR